VAESASSRLRFCAILLFSTNKKYESVVMGLFASIENSVLSLKEEVVEIPAKEEVVLIPLKKKWS
jgi:hypothetical protein